MSARKHTYKEGKRHPVTHRTLAQVKKMQKGYNEKPRVKAARKKQDAARATLEKEGKVRPNDGKDVHHKNPIRKGGTNKRSNLAVISASKNRGWRNMKRGKKK